MMNVSLLNPLYVSGATIKHLDCAIVNKKGVQPFVACAFRLPPSDLHNTSIEQSTPMSVNFHTACSHCANIGGIQRREQELKAQYPKSIERKRWLKILRKPQFESL